VTVQNSVVAVEVDEVDVEVDGQTVTGGERREGSSGAAQRIRGGAARVLGLGDCRSGGNVSFGCERRIAKPAARFFR
jgi:hypothetical protein